LFVLYSILFCLFLGWPRRAKTRVTSSSNTALPTPSVQVLSNSTDKDMAWWVKIVTETPHCTYFFGPFESANEAMHNQSGYVEDLEQEGAMGIGISVLQDRPEALTIYDE
jgi:hypothetical protein